MFVLQPILNFIQPKPQRVFSRWQHSKYFAIGCIDLQDILFIQDSHGILTKPRDKFQFRFGLHLNNCVHFFSNPIGQPEIFDRVQDMMKQRGYRGGYSGITIFSSKIVCGECGGWYGSKVWHSTDKYRRIIWQCNAKFKEKKHCRTPHLTEYEIKAAFVRVMGKLTTDRAMILEELREDQAMLTGTEDLEKE